jgi:predicted nucleic acid-binding Zn ribbon protein
VPVYVFSCPVCNGENELLLKLGDTVPRPCPAEGCEGAATLKFSRVAVKYDAFGFTRTDQLVSDPQGKSFRDLRTKAEEIADI